MPTPGSNKCLLYGMAALALALAAFTFFHMGGLWIVGFVLFAVAITKWGDEYILPVLFCLAVLGLLAEIIGGFLN